MRNSMRFLAQYHLGKLKIHAYKTTRVFDKDTLTHTGEGRRSEAIRAINRINKREGIQSPMIIVCQEASKE